MNKHFNIECSEYLAKLEYKPCVEYKKMNNKAMKTNNYTRSKRENKVYQKLANEYDKYKKL